MPDHWGAMNARVLDDLGPLYHSYRLFGVENEQIGNFRVNQLCKEPIILGYMLTALAKVRRKSDMPVTFAELFCADGYFTMAANFFGATSAVGIDSNRDGWSNNAPEVARRLGLTGVRFEWRDVNSVTEACAYDIVANIGGLYHVTNPIEVLQKSYALARRYLIVQTVVSLANNGDDYFESPAPGWQHGCRFSAPSFFKTVERQGWKVLDAHFNELEGNPRPEDRGSLYFLIEKT
jgi:hypothetical protein